MVVFLLCLGTLEQGFGERERGRNDLCRAHDQSTSSTPLHHCNSKYTLSEFVGRRGTLKETEEQRDVPER